jgi:hypothetical protein
LAPLAIILKEGRLAPREVCLGRILEFFGVPWKEAAPSQLSQMAAGSAEYIAFGAVSAVAEAIKAIQEAKCAGSTSASFYAYAGDDRVANEQAIRVLSGRADLSLEKRDAGNLPVLVSKAFADLTGTLTGLEVSCRLAEEDNVLAGPASEETSIMATIISAGGSPVFVRCQHRCGTIFFATSSQIVDIDQPAPRGFYDVKEHFCSVVPLVMFVRFAFSDLAWHPQENGACLIIDDPLLKPRYGFCDFVNLSGLMQRHRFTTNIAFIPWNWRRTSPAAADFFTRQPRLFSVSVHGCDHVAGEFGPASAEVLDNRARLALSRMRNHQGRTGIKYDAVMVFPQGVFCSKSPEALKRNGFLAAVNTETAPVDSQNARTQIRDVWDVAIMSYAGFPIFTRRYASHGLENFAFDLLLGKPCFIVAHHDFFKDGGLELVELIEKLCSLDAHLRWRPLGEAVRGACRRRNIGLGAEEVEMYGTELRIDNASDQAIEVKVRKRETQIPLVSEILCDDKLVVWTSDIEHLVFSGRIPPRSEKHFRVLYRKQADVERVGRSLPYEVSVALRRVLSEFRDDYLSKSHFLSATAGRFKEAITRNN